MQIRILGLLAVLVFSQVALADEGTPSIVHLAFRDHVVTISASPEGLLYSVRTASGDLLSESLTDEELLAAYPELHSHIRSSYANDGSGSFIWAGRDEIATDSSGEVGIETD